VRVSSDFSLGLKLQTWYATNEHLPDNNNLGFLFNTSGRHLCLVGMVETLALAVAATLARSLPRHVRSGVLCLLVLWRTNDVSCRSNPISYSFCYRHILETSLIVFMVLLRMSCHRMILNKEKTSASKPCIRGFCKNLRNKENADVDAGCHASALSAEACSCKRPQEHGTAQDRLSPPARPWVGKHNLYGIPRFCGKIVRFPQIHADSDGRNFGAKTRAANK